MSDGGIVTLLFTDVVGSVELKQRLGDERAEHIRRDHFRALREAIAARGGREVKSLGDGLMVVFGSAVEACTCAVAIQDSVDRQNRASETRLGVRVGLHVGEPIRDEDDYYGSAVDIAKRLCDRAEGGQIVASDLVRGLVGTRAGHDFRPLGEFELKGVTEPVRAYEVAWERAPGASPFTRTPFVGRREQRERLAEHLRLASAGDGGLVMLVGEPGIGKTRLMEEVARRAREDGVTVLWGRCYEGEWTPPYGPFAEAIAACVQEADVDVRHDLGFGAAPIAQFVPVVRERFPDVGEPAPLPADEERFRLLDAVAQFLIALSRRAPLMLVLDDLHWADRGTIAMLRHVVRYVGRNRILVVGAYRDVELDRTHPLAESLGELRRETEYDRVRLAGLGPQEVGELLAQIAERDVPDAFTKAIVEETGGVPFFVREVLLHLVDEGKLFRGDDGRWTSNLAPDEMGIPEGVREVIGRRISRLSEDANKLLSVAGVFQGPFRLDVAADVAGLDEMAALDAVDEALTAQVLQSGDSADTYMFTHALIRHTLAAEMNPSRLVRTHRRVAEALESAYGADPTPAQSAEIAYQYHRSSAVPGGDRGVEHALRAAEHASETGAHDEAVALLRVAVELLEPADPRRPRALARLGIETVYVMTFDEGIRLCEEAAELIVAAEGNDAAADYLAEAAGAIARAAGMHRAWELARWGLELVGDRRDKVWARLLLIDAMRREAEDPDNPGIPMDTLERRDAMRAMAGDAPMYVVAPWGTRADFLNHPGYIMEGVEDPGPHIFWTGEYRRALELIAGLLPNFEAHGALPGLVIFNTFAARLHIALGDLDMAREALRHADEYAERFEPQPTTELLRIAAVDELLTVVDEGWETVLTNAGRFASAPDPAVRFALAAAQGAVARIFARLGITDQSLSFLDGVIVPIERAPATATNYVRLICDAAEALWLLERTDHIETIEQNLLDKVIAPDFRYPSFDGRLSLARLCALQARYDDASGWFAQARVVLDEQGARPLRAITDHDEALMYARRDAPGDRERARPLLDAAAGEFESIGMPGWLRRAAELDARLAQVR